MERHECVMQGSLDLVRGNMVRIEDGRGMLVRVTSGSVWITQAGDPRDRFVSAGGRFRVASRGLTLISALSRSTIALSSPCEPRASWFMRLRARLTKAWKGLYVAGARPTTAAL